MDHGIAAGEAKSGFDIARCMAHQKTGFLRPIGRNATRDLMTIGIKNAHRIPMLEPAINTGNASRQKVFTRHDCLCRAGIDNDRPGRLERGRNPVPTGGKGLSLGRKTVLGAPSSWAFNG